MKFNENRMIKKTEWSFSVVKTLKTYDLQKTQTPVSI